MPGAGSGKRSIKGLTNKMAGVSATQKVRAAEWTGELQWVNSHHPPGAGASGSRSGAGAGAGYYSGGGDDVDYNHPWFERKSGEMYCNLCGAFATWEHVNSSRHQTRAANPQWYGFGTSAGTEYDKPWFEEREGAWYCLLCNSWATDTHITCERHRSREAAPHCYGFGPAAGAGGPAAGGSAAGGPAAGGSAAAGEWALAIPAAVGASPAAGDVPDEYAQPWFTEKDGGYYCQLCGAWADWTHLQCEKHRKRSANPEWYGFPLQAQPAQRAAAPQPAAQACPAQGNIPVARADSAGWSKYWSTEHKCHYYHNAQTKVTQWEPPYTAEEALPPPMPQTVSAPAASSAAASAAPGDRPPFPWKEYIHSDNKPYYYNPVTKISQWEFPIECC